MQLYIKTPYYGKNGTFSSYIPHMVEHSFYDNHEITPEWYFAHRIDSSSRYT